MITNGARLRQVKEILLHLAPHAGYPVVLEALLRLKEIQAWDEAIGARLMALDTSFGTFVMRETNQVWNRGLLSAKERVYISLAVDVIYQTLGEPFRFHLQQAFRQGVNSDQIKAVIRFLAEFSMVRAWEAFAVLQPLLTKRNLDTLSPAERLAFVLHDIFCVPFDEIAPIVERSPMATRQLASRARRRVRGSAMVKDADLASQRDLVDAFLAASREGSFDALLAVLDPDIVVRADHAAVSRGAVREVRGAQDVARGARHLLGRIPFAQPVLVDGAVGIVMAPRGWLLLRLIIRHGKIVAIDVVADPAHLHQLHLAVLPD